MYLLGRFYIVNTLSTLRYALYTIYLEIGYTTYYE